MRNLQKFILNGGTLENLISKVTFNNPLVNNLIKMAKTGNSQGVETFARNLFKEQGRDFDAELAEFKKKFK